MSGRQWRWSLAGLFVVTALAAGLVATQSVAAAYRDAPSLGWRLGTFGGRVWYAPWAYVVWQSRAAEGDGPVYARARQAAQLPVVGGVLVLLFMLRYGRSAGPTGAHGTARWATERELRRKGLLAGGTGVVLCQTADARFDSSGRMTRGGRVLQDDSPAHTLVFASSRSGKGVGLVLPTAVSWAHSAIILDVKREIWTASSGFRGQLGPCVRFEPTSADSAQYNPLAEVRRGSNEVRDAQAVATMLVDPTGEKEQDHWQKTATTLLTGAILHVLYSEQDKTLRGLATFLANPACSQFDTLDRMMTTHHLPSGPHPVVAECAKEISNKAEQELSGVFSTASACLGLYRDPVVARATSGSDFRIADLMFGSHPVSLYLVLPPSDLSRLRPLIRLVLDQIGRRLLEEHGDGAAKRHRLLLLLDEVALLGRLAFLEEGMPVFAGYGIKAFLIMQDLIQLEAKYTEKQSLLSNCPVRVAFGVAEDRTADRVSKMLGQATRASVNRSVSGSVFKRQESRSHQEHQRLLMTADEVATMPDTDALVLVAGMPPYRGKKIRFYTDQRFLGRLSLPALRGEAEVTRRLPRAHPWVRGV